MILTALSSSIFVTLALFLVHITRGKAMKDRKLVIGEILDAIAFSARNAEGIALRTSLPIEIVMQLLDELEDEGMVLRSKDGRYNKLTATAL